MFLTLEQVFLVMNHEPHNSMILSTLSINSHGFTFGFLERPRTNGDSILYV